jgi:anti-sigma B factor antagonist
MDLYTSLRNGCLVVHISGELDTTTSPELDAVLAKESPAAKNILFSLGAMDYISSVGLRTFLANLKRVKGTGGRMALADLNEEVREVFDMAGFSALFEIYATLSEAEQALGI